MARILVVDDEVDIVRMVVATLKARGHDVTVARDGHAALERCASEPPDLLVLDANLPKVDGPEVVRRLRELSATARLPIVLMSAAYISLGDADSTRGADAFVTKPFVRETLLRNVDRLLKARA